MLKLIAKAGRLTKSFPQNIKGEYLGSSMCGKEKDKKK